MKNSNVARETLKTIAAALVAKRDAVHMERQLEENNITQSMLAGKESGLDTAIQEIEDALCCDDDEIKEYFK